LNPGSPRIDQETRCGIIGAQFVGAQAFRIARPFDAGAVPADRRVYGVWSVDGSLWQAARFLIPLIGIVAILVDSTGVLHR
jgi:hypothetical protein